MHFLKPLATCRSPTALKRPDMIPKCTVTLTSFLETETTCWNYMYINKMLIAKLSLFQKLRAEKKWKKSDIATLPANAIDVV